jgi:hypothetical protein
MSDLSFFTRKSGSPQSHHKLDLAAEKRALHRFVQRVRMRLSATVPPGPNQVVVTDGMGNHKTYPSITEGMNSITNASETNEYTVSVGSGTYNESLAMKSWVYLTGAGVGQTIINSSVPAVKAAANSSVQLCTIQATGKSSDTYAIAVSVLNSPKFMLSGCTIIANDAQGAPGGNILALVVDWPDGSARNSTCFVSDSRIEATEVKGADNATAVVAGTGSLLQIETSTLTPSGPNAYGLGGASIDKSALDLGWVTVSGSGYALWCDNSGATCVATDCTINGAVTPNVKIINDPE